MSPSPAPYNVRMDNEAAKGFVDNGGTLLFLGVPPRTIVGVDHQAFSAGPKFMGIKMIPPGTHFISCRATSQHAGSEVAPCISFFIHIRQKEVLVRKWDQQNEVLAKLVDEDEMGRYIAGVRRYDFDQYLAPWSDLSRFLTPSIISDLSPVGGGGISIMDEAEDPDLLEPKTDAEKALVQQLQKGRADLQAHIDSMSLDGGNGDDSNQGPSTVPPPSTTGTTATPMDTASSAQAQLPRLVKQKGMTAEELTAANMDKSGLLEQIIRRKYDGNMEGILAELQFSFIAFVFGQSLDGFSQWKSLISLLMGCEEAAIRTHPKGFTHMLYALRIQLASTLGPSSSQGQQPGSTGQDGSGDGGGAPTGHAAPFGVPLVEELLPDSFLRKSFAEFFGMMQENSADLSADLQREAQELKKLLRSTLGWEFDMQLLCDGSEDEEDLPPSPARPSPSEPSQGFDLRLHRLRQPAKKSVPRSCVQRPGRNPRSELSSILSELLPLAPFWKSNKMHWCEVCRCWMNDSKASIQNHERAKLRDMSKKMDQDKRDAARAEQAHQTIEEKARKQFEEDLKAQQAATASTGTWVWEEESKYYYHAIHRWYYDPTTEFYYGGEPAAWSKVPAVPATARFGVAPHLGGPVPQGGAAARPGRDTPHRPGSPASALRPAPAAHSHRHPGRALGGFVRRAQAGYSTAAAASAPPGAKIVQRVVQLPSHPLMAAGGYQAPVGVGRVGAAKGLGLQGAAKPTAVQEATAESIKRKREAEGKPLSDAEAEAQARREAARARVQQRTATQFGYM
eukprot:gene14528-20559_t